MQHQYGVTSTLCQGEVISTVAARGSLRREPVARPAGRVAPVEHAIVQARRLALPELDRIGDDAIAAPVRRPRQRGITMIALDLRDERLERGPALDHLGLRRRDRADLAAP